jgi:tellurite resistance protein TerC
MGFPIETVIIFIVTVLLSLYMDLWVHRKAEDITLRDSVLWSIFWICLSMGFYGYLHWHHSAAQASLFLTGYVLEKTLSVDNLMVFIAVFSYFGIKGALQHRILYYGILGAIVFRLIFVALGNTLMALGGYADLLFAAIIGYSAVMMLKGTLSGGGDGDEEPDYTDHKVVKFANKMFQVFPRLDGHHFFVKGDRARELAAKDPSIKLPDGGAAKRYITPAFVCLMVIEASDVMFAFDSVPAVIAVTREPLLVFSAMIFAILGLRSLYFVLAVLTKYLVYLEKSVMVLLFFIAIKLALHGINSLFGIHIIELSSTTSLLIILGVLAAGVVASLVAGPKDEGGPSDGTPESGSSSENAAG